MNERRADAATRLRAAVAALSERLASDFGDLAPDASPERTAALLATLAQDEARATPEQLRTLDSWIRLADSAVLHDDPAEAEARTTIARELRDVRALVAPDAGPLTADMRTD